LSLDFGIGGGGEYIVSINKSEMRSDP
jgi:hypothetical protein